MQMAKFDTRILALESRSGRGTQDIVVIDEADAPFMMLMQGDESLQDFERQVAAVRSEALLGLRTVTPPRNRAGLTIPATGDPNERAVAALGEAGRWPDSGRPPSPGVTSDEFLGLSFRTIAEVPVVANAAAYDEAVEVAIGPWVRAMTPDEARWNVDTINALEAERLGN
jgi:hypothetical protein